MKLKFLTLILTVCILAGLAFAAISFFSRPRYSSVAVLTRVQDLNRLETVVYRYEKVIDEGNAGSAVHDLLFGDRILLIAQGDVTAGVDLSKLNPSHIAVTNSSVTIKLPPAEILSARLDNENTRVYDRRLGLLTKGDAQLEQKARLEAEQVIRSQACKDDILKKAGDNASQQLSLFLKLFGFTEVRIEETNSSCK